MRDEVHQYINKNYPNLTYHLESRRGNAWQVTFDKYPQMPIEISEVLHTSAPVVPQVERILITNIPLITAFPLMKNYLTAEELSYATYDTSSLYIEMPIPYSAIENHDVTNFTIEWINSAKNMLQHIQISKKKYILESS